MFARKAPLPASLAAISLAVALLGFQPLSQAADDATARPTSGERETGRKAYEEIIKVYGRYEDQSLQDYVNALGQNLLRHSPMAGAEFHFTILDTDDQIRLLKQLQSLATAPAIDYEAYLERSQTERGATP